MSDTDDLILDCRTCVAANTTACNECVVNHLLANDAGPIEFVPTLRAVMARSQATHGVDRAVAMFVAAGLCADEPEWIERADFEAGRVPQLTS